MVIALSLWICHIWSKKVQGTDETVSASWLFLGQCNEVTRNQVWCTSVCCVSTCSLWLVHKLWLYWSGTDSALEKLHVQNWLQASLLGWSSVKLKEHELTLGVWADCHPNKFVPAEGTSDIQQIPVYCMDFQEELIKKLTIVDSELESILKILMSMTSQLLYAAWGKWVPSATYFDCSFKCSFLCYLIEIGRMTLLRSICAFVWKLAAKCSC